MNINKWLLLSVIFNLQIDCAESKEEKKAKATEQKIEAEDKEAKFVINPKEIEDKLKGILELRGLYGVLQNEVMNYVGKQFCCTRILKNAHNQIVSSLYCLPNGNLVSGSADGIVKIWDINTLNCLKEIQVTKKLFIDASKICIDGNGCLIYHSDEEVRILNNDICIKKFDDIQTFCVLPNGNLVLGTTSSKFIFLDRQYHIYREIVSGHKISFFKDFCLLSNGNLVSCSVDKIKIWDVNTYKCLQTINIEEYLSCSCVLPNNNLVLGEVNKIKVLDIETGACLQTFDSDKTDFICHLCMLPNGNLVSSSENKQIKIWDIEKGICLQILNSDPDIFCVLALPNGDLVTGLTDGTIKIWSKHIEVGI